MGKENGFPGKAAPWKADLLGPDVGQAQQADHLALGSEDPSDLDRPGGRSLARDVAVEDERVLGCVDLDVIARRDLLEPLAQQGQVGLDQNVEEDRLARVEDHERGGADRLAVDEDLARRDHEHVGDGRVRDRDPRERLLEVEHLGLPDGDLEPEQGRVCRAGDDRAHA